MQVWQVYQVCTVLAILAHICFTLPFLAWYLSASTVAGVDARS
jgi:hypothetical protein